MKSLNFFFCLFSFLILTNCSFFDSDKIDLLPFLQKEKWGYIDLQGKIVINPQFTTANYFNEGLALVSTGDKYGYIDKTGKYVINPSFIKATDFSEDVAFVVKENTEPIAINKKGETLFSLKQAEFVNNFSNDFAAFAIEDLQNNTDVNNENYLWGFIDKSGKEVIKPQFKDVGDFIDGLCNVTNKEGKWGFIDKTGDIKINFQFDYASSFYKGKAAVKFGDKWGVIDTEGKYILNAQFDDLIVDDNGFMILQGDKYGWCDKDGKFIINPQFESTFPFIDSDLAPVLSNKKWGYIDKKGKYIINPQFDDAFVFFDDFAVIKSGEKYGLIDKLGKIVVNPQFEQIKPVFFDNSFVSTDYVDITSIIEVINLSNPEGLNFSSSFFEIANKYSKSANDFNSYDSAPILVNKKQVNSFADYNFQVLGNFVSFNYDNYENVFNNDSPYGFVYSIIPKGRAIGKEKNIYTGFQNKLKNFLLVKKGLDKDNFETFIYTNNSKSLIIVVHFKEYNFFEVAIFNKNKVELTKVLDIIEEGSQSVENQNIDELDGYRNYTPIDSTATVVDSAAAE